jgi:hypothetical protein
MEFYLYLFGMSMIAFSVAFIVKRSCTTTQSNNNKIYKDLDNILDQYQTYACSDAATYAHCMKPGKQDEIQNRYKHIPEHIKRLEAQANSSAQPDPKTKQYTISQITRISKLIDSAKSGCCTTLAISAAQKIITLFPDLRVEIVGSKVERGMTAHCFILINRKPIQGELSGEVSPRRSWGNDVLIIDPWLVSLGWKGVFKANDYPFSGFLENLTSFFDSKKLEKKETEKQTEEVKMQYEHTPIQSVMFTPNQRDRAENGVRMTDFHSPEVRSRSPRRPINS